MRRENKTHRHQSGDLALESLSRAERYVAKCNVHPPRWYLGYRNSASTRKRARCAICAHRIKHEFHILSSPFHVRHPPLQLSPNDDDRLHRERAEIIKLHHFFATESGETNSRGHKLWEDLWMLTGRAPRLNAIISCSAGANTAYLPGQNRKPHTVLCVFVLWDSLCSPPNISELTTYASTRVHTVKR